MKTKTVKFVFKVILIFVLIYISIILTHFIYINGAWKFFKSSFAGGYPYAESWDFNINEQKLVQIIKSLKKEKPQLFIPYECCPDTVKSSYWYYFTFYNKTDNKELHVRLRGNTVITTLYFDSIIAYCDSLTPPKDIQYVGKEINHDFDYYENKAEIKKFEENILKPIQHKIDSINNLK